LSAAEAETRRGLRLPPFSALALLSGEEADAVAGSLRSAGNVEVGEKRQAGYLIRASDEATLADELAGFEVASLQLRVEVDPVGV
jgi:hypothetical protein